jgi:hypothetical protein
VRVATLATILISSVIVACFVDRPTEELSCSNNSQCAGFGEFRVCGSGYCVVPNCPADCTSCDEAAMTCQVDCTTAQGCSREITCPAGWSCTINCVGDGACSDIECQAGAKCVIACTGDNACGDVRCSSACQCDLDCVGAACDSKSCPTIGNGGNQVRCTSDGTATGECDSTVDSRCTRC